MRSRTVYLDHAATSFPKPQCVIKEVTRAMRQCGNPGRGSHSLAVAAAEAIYDCRERAAHMFGAEPERVILTMNATHALNMAIKGFLREDDHVLISDMEHNSVLRPVYKLQERGVSFDVYGSFGGSEERVLDSISEKLRENTRMIIANHASNISNITLPIESIGKFCRERGIIFIVDASQSAGRLPIDVKAMNIDALCMPGHKGLMGPQGSGLLILGDGVELPDTFIEGGSGSNSLDLNMPDDLPDHLEGGTLMTPAAAGLAAGIEWVGKIGIDCISRHENYLGGVMRRELSGIDGITIYGSFRPGPITLFGVHGYTPAEVGRFLDSRGICVRDGFHCSPLAHASLGTGENGAVRASVGYENTLQDVERFIDAVRELVKRKK